MREGLERIESRLGSEARKVVAYFANLTDPQWDQQIYTTGSRWRTRHVLAHFVSAERSFAILLQIILAGGSGAPANFDIDEFNEREVSANETGELHRLLEEFSRAREQMVALARVMKAEDLDLRGRHPWLGQTSIGDMLKLVYRHNMIHMRDIRRALQSGTPVPHLDVQPPAAFGASGG
jgi:uncharacterized protein (TIGR03083 family)